MYQCVICRGEVEADDAELVNRELPGRCICLRCWTRETGTTRYLSRELCRELVAAAGSE